LGVFDLTQALKKAREKGLDLIKITEKTSPPVCKIGDYGKYHYLMQKKARGQKHKKAGELKNIRLTFAMSEHDLETRLKTAEKFLKKGIKVRIEMILRGRQKRLAAFAEKKLNLFLQNLSSSLEFNVERPVKKEGRGFTVIVSSR